MRWDRNGNEIIELANVPGSGVSKRSLTQKSGNPRHDTRSGKFGVGGGQKKSGAPVPANANAMEYNRFIDTVRLASRQFQGELNADEIAKFLKGQVKNVGQVDINGFMAAVEQQRMANLIDAIDQRLRSKGLANIGIRVSAPNGYIKATLKELTPDQIADVGHRVEALGHSIQDVDRFMGRRVDQEALDAAARRREATRTNLRASDEDYSLWSVEMEYVEPEEDAGEKSQDIRTEMTEILKSMPQPQIHFQPEIKVEMPPPPKRKMKYKRNEKTGLIEEVEDV